MPLGTAWTLYGLAEATFTRHISTVSLRRAPAATIPLVFCSNKGGELCDQQNPFIDQRDNHPDFAPQRARPKFVLNDLGRLQEQPGMLELLLLLHLWNQ